MCDSRVEVDVKISYIQLISNISVVQDHGQGDLILNYLSSLDRNKRFVGILSLIEDDSIHNFFNNVCCINRH